MSKESTKLDIERYLKDEKNFRALESFIQDQNKKAVTKTDIESLASKRKDLRKQQYSRYKQLRRIAKL